MVKNDRYTQHLVERSKYSKRVILNPFGMSFRWCNNNCKFCYLRDIMYKKPLSTEDMDIITDNMVEWLDLYCEDFPSDVRIGMILIGGEFYCLGDEYYDCIKRCVDKTSNILKKHNVKFYNVGICSNLLLNDDRVNKIIEFHDYCMERAMSCDIFTSFDLWGRFQSEESCKQWFNNILKLKDYMGIGIEMMLSKPGIQNYLYNDTCYEARYFDELLELKEQIHINGEGITRRELTPDTDEIVAFFKKILERHGLINILEEFEIDPNRQQLRDDAPSMLVGFDKDGVIEKYCDALFKRTTHNESDDDNFYCIKDPKKHKYYLDNVLGCGHCKYREHCHMNNEYTCFICYRSYNGLIKPNQCYMKEVYKLVEKHRELYDEHYKSLQENKTTEHCALCSKL